MSSNLPQKNLIVIPSRLQATRLPNKPLADIAGMPMVMHVWRHAMAAGIGDVVVACADAAIAEVITQAGGTAIMTSPDLPSGTDRVCAAWQSLPNSKDYTAIVNVQGDLPTLDPRCITKTVAAFYATPDAAIMTPVTLITDTTEIALPSVVKVAAGTWQGDRARALYFSRSGIPNGADRYYHHIGLYVFKPAMLAAYTTLPPTRLEKEERLEQLRALEAGFPIYITHIDTATPFGVDTPDDLEKARHILGHYTIPA